MIQKTKAKKQRIKIKREGNKITRRESYTPAGGEGQVKGHNGHAPISWERCPCPSATLPRENRSVLDWWMQVPLTNMLELSPGIFMQNTQRFQNRDRVLKISDVE